MRGDRTYFWLAGLLVVLSLPARFSHLNQSLWMDEAWVANSLLEPSLYDVFFTKTWTQSSPPLFLLLARWTIGLLGWSEAALRVLPSVAGLAGLLLAGWALRRWLSTPAALLGLTLLCGNYWLIKYCQQVKQYGTDFFVSALLLVLVGRYLESASWRHLVALLAAGAAGVFFSYTTVFWLGTLLITAALPGEPAVSRVVGLSRLRWLRMVCAGCVLGLVLLLAYTVFVRPNRSAALIRNFQSSYLDPFHPWATLRRLISTLGLLLVAHPGLFPGMIGLAAAALAGYTAVRAIRGSLAGHRRGLLLTLAGTLPLACTLAAGTLGLYPVLDYPRMLLFSLPCLALLLACGAEMLLTRLMRDPARHVAWRAAVFAACAAAVVASQGVFFRYPRPAEENRPAVAFLKAHLNRGDLLFVHPGMYEQLKYYRKRLDFRPDRVYVGNVQWPCCATGDRREATKPQVKSLADDLLEAASGAGGHGLWLLFPAGSAGHWSGIFRDEIRATSTILIRGGCKLEARRPFGLTLVESYSCRQ
jgi:hypothetical protein